MSLEERAALWARGWRGPLVAAVVAILAGLPGLFAMPPIDRDEARFAQATAQMMETGDLVSIRFQEQPRNKKPVGIHWLQVLSVGLFSHVEDRVIWPYRIPSLLGAALAAAACAWGAGAFVGRGAAMLAGAALGAVFMLSTEAFFAKTDALLCGSVTLAMAALARIYLAHKGPTAGPRARFRAGLRVKMAFWLGLTAAVMDKGPVGPMIVGLALVSLAAWDRDAGWMKDLGWGWGVIFLAAVVGPWAMAITVNTDGAFWRDAVGGDLGRKLAGGQESHGAWPGYYVALLPLVLFPATLLLPAALATAWRARTEPAVRFAVCWLLPAWLVLELVPTKLPHYTLPLLPALIWLIARALTAPIGQISRYAGAALTGLVGVAFAAVGLVAVAILPAPNALAWAIITGVAFVAAAAGGAVLLLRQAAGRGLALSGALAVVAHGLMFGALAPALGPLWLSQQAADALTHAGLTPREGMTAGPVAAAGYDEPSLVFALGTSTELGDAQAAADAIADGRPVIVEQRQMAAFNAALAINGDGVAPVAVLEGLDYSNGRHDILHLFRPLPPPPAPAKDGP
jgi:4-amino-4-deoxy-L-arabinose transferase-like glycosyltransferase